MAPITDVAPLLLEARLRMDVHHTPEAVVLTLEGELDLATTPMLKTALALVHAGGTCPLVMLDLAGVGFMDGAGVGCITRAARRLGERGVALAVIHPSRPVRRLLELCDLGRLMRWEGLNAGRPRAARQEATPAAQGAGCERQGSYRPAA
jgi:anti-anti-sigma factor